jgi:hypothetical protein
MPDLELQGAISGLTEVLLKMNTQQRRIFRVLKIMNERLEKIEGLIDLIERQLPNPFDAA